MYNRWIYDKVNNLVEKYHTRNPEELLDLLGIKLHYIDSPSKLLGVYQVILRNRVILIANNIGSLKKIVLAHEIGHDQLHKIEQSVRFPREQILHRAVFVLLFQIVFQPL